MLSVFWDTFTYIPNVVGCESELVSDLFFLKYKKEIPFSKQKTIKHFINIVCKK